MSATSVERLNAALEGRYRIERELGQGGMATVYLARDEKHNRNVALKVLKPELAAVVGAERFLAEIKTTANLQHPHILPLFDSGEAGRHLFYVMPYVEGETLRDRLDREHQLPVDEAVQIATNVAEALDYAHRHGVVHRDIKPANILLQDGKPVLSDFGIALAVGVAGGGRLTETGLSLGTPQYMSPEQATGDLSVGAPTDIYALGCVLYEMLVGDPPYTASTPQAILGKIIAGKLTSATEQRASVPPNVDAAIRKAMERVPADRFVGVKAFASALADPAFTYGIPSKPSKTVRAGRAWGRAWTATAAALLAALAAWGWLRPMPEGTVGVPTRGPLTGLTITGTFGIAVSPDGRWIAAREVNGTGLFLRPASGTEWREVGERTSSFGASFSPASDWLAVSLGTGIVKVPVQGGPGIPIALGALPRWAANDSIVFVEDPQAGGRILMTGPDGGDVVVLYESDSVRAAVGHLLPDSRGVLFQTPTGGDPLNGRIYVFDRRTGETREIQPSGVDPRYVSSGHLLFGHGSQVLMAAPFDLGALEVTGPAVAVLAELRVNDFGVSSYDVSRDGTLVYVSREPAASYGLVEVTLDGEEHALDHVVGDFALPRYSPDGSRIAYEALQASGNAEARIFDLTTGADRQFTSGGGSQPVWSSDGEDLFYTQLGTGYRRPADASEGATPLVALELPVFFSDVHPDGSALLGDVVGRDLYVVRPGSEEPEALVVGDGFAGHARFSPDGRWVAYTADHDGELRVYANSFPDWGSPRSISPGFAVDPVWSPDGRTIYYRSGDRFYSIAIRTEPTLAATGSPRELFQRPGFVPRGAWFRNWDLHPDGDRFLMFSSAGVRGEASFNTFFVTSWFEELRERVPTH